MTTALQKVGAVAVTAVGSVVGALAGGPVGLGAGLAGGALVDILRAHFAKPAASILPTAGLIPPTGGVPSAGAGMMATAAPPGLPPGANTLAAGNTVHLLLLNRPKEAAYWLSLFQASVNLPNNGKLDAATRALLVTATAGTSFDASKLPAVTGLG